MTKCKQWIGGKEDPSGLWSFSHRIFHNKQDTKMADIWLRESIWGNLKQRVKDKETKSKADLNHLIRQCWRGMAHDKTFFRTLITPIHMRLETVMDQEARQLIWMEESLGKCIN